MIVTLRYLYTHVHRLLDVHCSRGRYEHELIVYMVFEYMEQDLDKFIRQSRLDRKLTKVIDKFISSCCTLHFLRS
jgi:hypothetical protein